MNLGDMWYDTSEGALHILINNAPITWSQIQVGNTFNSPFGFGTSLPSTCSIQQTFYLTTSTVGLYYCTATNTWSVLTPLGGGGGGSIPSGLITLILSGTCPTGFTEVSALNRKFLRGTVAANGDVGLSAGNDAITPSVNTLTSAAQVFTGTAWTAPVISWPVGVPVFTGTSGTVPAETFTGSSATSSAVTAGTPAGTISTPTFTGSALAGHAHELPFQIPTTTTTRQIAAATFGTRTSRAATAVSATGTANTTSAAVALSQSVSGGTPAGTISTPTFTGSALATHTHTLTATGSNGTVSFTPVGTIAWPMGVPTIAAYTPAGSNGASSVTGTLNSFDNRPAYTNVIFCSKN